MPLLLLIRHGQNDFVKKGKLAGRQPGIHLNETGLQEAADLATALAGQPVTAIYSSPLERALETAAPLAEQKQLDIKIFPELSDTDIGKWENQSLKSLRKNKLWDTVQHAPSRMNFPQGESFLESQTRAVNIIETILRAHKPKDLIAIFTHADPIKLAVAYYLGMPLDHFQRIMIDTGSISILRLGDRSASLMRLNFKPAAFVDLSII
ncbi:MAG: histidine phosphatase family protein [Anaerolineales bacterium]|nr:histidine phosphatase family protein [Anaerolineales bacterium]